MWGDLTDNETKKKVEEAYTNSSNESLEILVYKKSSKLSFWVFFSFITLSQNKIFLFKNKKPLYGYQWK